MEERIEEVRREVDKQLKIISEISNWRYRTICLFSLLDCFAQEVKGYENRHNREAFCSFIKKYDDTFAFWEEVDTVTFFYKNSKLFLGNDPTSFMGDGAVYYCKDLIDRQTQDLFFYVDKKMNETELNKHRYVNLFYILRNKLVHELSAPHGLMWCADEDEPFYTSYTIISSSGEKDTWALTFPSSFIYNVVNRCIYNYLDECERNQIDPFQNSDPLRDYYITWVE